MNRQKKSLLNQTYRRFLRIGLSLDDAKGLRAIVDKQLMGFGTTADEKVMSFKEIRELVRLQKKQSKGMDLQWKIKPLSHYTSEDENTAVYADELFLKVNSGEGIVKIYMRSSIILTYINGQWKVIHWHASKPENVRSNEDTFGIDKLRKKADELEKLVQEKTNDLVIKNRELEIEAALERVRSRSMAMRTSKELREVAREMRNQFSLLGQKELETCAIHLWNESSHQLEAWAALRNPNDTGEIIESETRFDIKGIRLLEEAFKKYVAGKKDYVIISDMERAKEFFKAMKKVDPEAYTFLSNRTKNIKPKGITAYWSVSDFIGGSLVMVTVNPPDENSRALLRRFASVFGQAYQRFKDLQKAEAQVREAQIEAALEKVRSSSLAMHRSDEMQGVVNMVIDQLKNLNIILDTTNILIFDNEDKSIDFWTGSNSTGTQLSTSWKVPYFDILYYKKIWAVKESGQDLFSASYSFKEKNKIFTLLFSNSDFKNLNTQRKQFILKSPRATIVAAIAKDTAIQVISYSRESFLVEEIGILKRFSKVFSQAYTRFLDLQKAEAQAREAQIEAALERVRSRSMAMHKSDELKEVIRLVLEQFVHLKINAAHAGFYIDYKAQDDMHIWLADPNIEPFFAILPYFDTPTWNSFLEAKAKGTALHTDLLDFKEKNKFYNSLFKLFKVPEEAKQFYMQCKGLAVSTVLLDSVGLYIENFEGIPYSDEENKVLLRFGKVFQQTYTRFIDLQKAEAQAREAQIEAALERVRSRSLAMHRSDELKEVIDVVFSNLNDLNISRGSVAIWLFDKQTMNGDFWVATPLHKPEKINLPYDKELMKENTSYKDSWEAFSEGKSFFNKGYSKQQKDRYFNYVFSNNDLSIIPQATRDLILKSDMHSANLVVEKHSTLFFDSWNGVIYDPDSIAIFKRISRVFEQAYVRFLDLQKAEAQAREARIEAGLERVRSRAMAMQTSEELSALIGIVFAELTKLDVNFTRCAILIYESDKKGLRQWMVNSETPSVPMSFYVAHTSLPYLDALLKGWEERSLKWEYILEGKNKFITDEYLFNKTELSCLPEFVIAGMKAPEKVHISASFNNFGCVTLASLDPLSADNFDILLRFANVFDLTYTRFNDLQVAEARAREAQVEAALERVRSRTMAMQKSDELLPTAEIMFDQLKLLGIDLQGVAFAICDKNSTMVQKWTSIGNFSHPYDIEPGEQRMYEAWKNQSGMYEEVYEGEKQKKYYEKFMEIPEFRKGLQKVIDLGIPIPAWQKNYAVPFKNGYVLFIITKPFDETQIFLRFGKVFEQTYTRFLDLQKAEAATKEVIKQSALDRIRADIASMRTTKDLERITPLIWNELTILGIPFIRCGVFIMDDEQQLIHTFLSTPEGKAIAAIHIPYSTPGKISLIPENWKKNSSYTDYWNDTDFIGFANTLKQNQVFESSKEYLDGIPHGGFYLHFVPFLQGMLYVGNANQLNEEEINLVQSLADAFSTAYSRYEDFNKLEAAKKQVDSTLTELQATQKQLIQSEKMASLGELTAGIAHEIQNPLNFVNNFSEVSTELIDEMKSELDKGDAAEAILIADDLKQNLEKINHHGKRADAIVKGMLQHSRTSTGKKEPTDINALCDEYLRLSYHGMRAKNKSFNAVPIAIGMKMDFDETLPKINVIPQDIGRVLLNLFNNAFYAAPLSATGGFSDSDNSMIPTVWVKTKKENDKVLISVRDNGPGIPKEILDKIFQPFFTTKPTGQGTGLGLSLSYDIVKAHGGVIKVETLTTEEAARAGKDGGSEFMIQLPAI